jgi:hypothetical protein
MKKLVLALSFCATAAFAAAEWKGVISESACGAAHADGSEKSRKCIEACVKGGKGTPVLVSEGKVMKIANPDKVMEHLGHKVVVTGDLKEDAVTIATVKMDQ